MKMKINVLLLFVKVYFFSFLFKILRFFVKKEENNWFFIPSHQVGKFSGNLKVFYYYVKENYPNYKQSVYLSGHATDEIGGRVSTMFGFLYHLVKAEHIIIDGTNPYLILSELSIVQLWHGCGLKRVGIENQNTDNLLMNLFKRHFRAYRLVSALSEEDKVKHNNDFRIEAAKVTGIARNDLFFKPIAQEGLLKRKLGIESFRRVITYAPTFRDNFTILNFKDEYWERLNLALKQQNDVLVVKKHPWDRFFKVPVGYSNIMDLSTLVDEVQELLIVTDLLISDYSSIVTDFVITKRPVLYYLFDHKLYLEKCRSMAGEVDQILPGPFVYDENTLLNYLVDDSWMEREDILEASEKFSLRYHKYFDGNSCERIFSSIKELN